jgi:CHASE2 domain-containing sensor protein
LLLPQLKPNAGGYKLTAKEAQGYQILLNYRSSLPQQIPLREILQGTRDQELSKLVSDRIIFLGRIGHNQDLHNTPYSKNQPSRQWSGVFIHAQMTSQIISAVLDERPLLWWLPEWLEVIWIGSWSLVGLAIIVAWDLVKQRIVAIAIALIILFGCCWLFLLFGGWLPLIPPALTLVITGAIFTFEGLKK